MKKITMILASAIVSFGAYTAQAANLWIVGDATPYGWSLDDATALLSTPENGSFYTGTVYLKANSNFKFMSVPDFDDTDYPQYGAAKDATMTDGKIALAAGTDDDFTQLQVSEDANYYITVDTEALEATIVKSEYQETEIGLCSLFLVGDATAGGWSVDDGTPLYQEKETPYVYSAAVELTEGEFKIATAMKGAGSWDAKYYYTRDPENEGKIVLGSSEDNKWTITEEATYTVTVNTIAETISIVKKEESSSVAEIILENNGNNTIEYFTLTGVRTANPTAGIYIVKQGNQVSKKVIK